MTGTASVTVPSALNWALLPFEEIPDGPALNGELPPTDEELWGLVPDPDSDPPDGQDAWMAELPADILHDYLDRLAQAEPQEALRAGLLPRDQGWGAGFAAGGVADKLAPGPALAGFAHDAWAGGLAKVSDDELIGLLRAWHRLNSWTAAGELAAVAELNRRRTAEVAAGADPHLAEHLSDELAVPLTLTTRAADALLDFSAGLTRLPLTQAALAAGDIDRVKALVIAEELALLDDAHAAAVEACVIERAGVQTTGQLRAAARRATLAADPDAANRRRDRARKDARVEVWDERSGTAALAGRDLPPAEVLAADRRINILARHLMAAGHDGTLDQLRARVYTSLLLGQPIGSDHGDHEPEPGHPAGAAAGEHSSGSSQPVERSVLPGSATGAFLGGSVNLTLPLATWLGESTAPGDVAGFGPLPADDARALAALIAAQPGSRWCLTLTDTAGRAIAHGCMRARPGAGTPGPGSAGAGASAPGNWALEATIRPLAGGECAHESESAGYRPSPSLRHLVNVRQRRCSFPGCRRPATRCDHDHTIPYDQGGRTCQCNLAPLCRRHHGAKQAQGWHLDQTQPGILLWRLPHGRSYRVEPDPYPAEPASRPAEEDP